jgi:hypothetical protein
MDFKAAANTQFFNRPEFGAGKKVLRVIFVSMGVGLVVAASNKHAPLTLGIAGGALLVSLGLLFAGQIRGGQDQGARTFWRTNAFSFFLMGLMLVPASLWIDHPLALATITAVSGLSLIAGVVGFCVGRFAFLLVFRPPNPDRGRDADS